MKIAEIEQAARDILELLNHYSGTSAAKPEMVLDLVLFAHFQVTFGHMSRQKYVYMHSSQSLNGSIFATEPPIQS